MSQKGQVVIHQAEVRYSDGAVGMFFSTDGRYFFEHRLPDPNASTRPMRFEREWLKASARAAGVDSIEFTEGVADPPKGD